MDRTRKALLRGQGLAERVREFFVPRDNEACRPMEMVIYTEGHEEEPVSKMVNSTEFLAALGERCTETVIEVGIVA